MTHTSPNVVWHDASVERSQREALQGHQSCLLWFTGLSGAGKSTIAQALDQRLHQMNCRSYVLDGDNIRHHLCGDLGFTDEDRTENIRRIGEVGRLFVDAGMLTLTAFISPLQKDRDTARSLLPEGDFIEIYCQCDIEICEQRDVKGLYKRARAGEIPHFTGISSPYEAPSNPELVIDCGRDSIDKCVDQIIGYLRSQGKIHTIQPGPDDRQARSHAA